MTAPTKAKHFWDQPEIYSAALGCSVCPLQSTCGGLHAKSAGFDCHDFCCGGLADCTTVCRRNPAFLEQFCEVGGFNLDRLPIIDVREPTLHSSVVPLIYHAAGRRQMFATARVCLRLREVLDLRTGQPRFGDREKLCKALQIPTTAEIFVSGIDHDPQVEAVWALSDRRQWAFRCLADLGIAAITTPNFSLVLDRPRGDNLHAMKRIGLLYNEMAEAGLPVVLHPNARTSHDMERWWAEFIEPRTNLKTLAYEFGTGSGHKGRIEAHCEWLNEIASKRPMTIIVRGNPRAIGLLSEFREILYVESTSFMKAVKRQWPTRIGNRRLKWETREGANFDPHLDIAAAEVTDLLQVKYFSERRLPS